MILVLLPAYNEEASLPLLLPRLQAVMTTLGQPWRIVVCNDGSSDRTLENLRTYAEQMPIEILNHRLNRGLGETVRDLFEYADEHCAPDDIVVRMDCDDTHEPQIVLQLIEKLSHGYDVALASRFEEGGGQRGVNRYRSFISYCATIYMRVFFPIKGVREYTCGFRAYRAGIIQKAVATYGNNFIQLKGLGFTGTLEKLIKLNLLGARFAEVPFVLRYDRKLSSSKMVSSITTLGYFVMTVLYHWPWGGWRSSVRRARATKPVSADTF